MVNCMFFDIQKTIHLCLVFLFFVAHQSCLCEIHTIEVRYSVNEAKINTCHLDLDSETDTVSFQKESLLTLINNYLIPESYQALTVELESMQKIPLNASLQKGMISIIFEEDSQDVFINIAPQLLKEQVHSFIYKKKKREWIHLPVIKPSPISSYIALNATQNFYKYYFSDAPSNSQTNLSSRFVFNLKDWIINGFGYFISYTKGPQSRLVQNLNKGSISVSRDFPKVNISSSFGDVGMNSTGFQGSLPIFGVTLANTKNMPDTQNDANSLNQHSFFLNTPSEVSVYVNDTFYRSMQLSAGPHRISNFPLADGVNIVDLKITDASGNESSITLNKMYNASILPVNHLAYSISFGFPRFQQPTQRYQYLFNKPIISINLSRGITPILCGNMYLQATRNSFFNGGTFVYAHKYFMCTSQYGISVNQYSQKGLKAMIMFKKRTQRNSTFPFSWSQNFSYSSKAFSTVGQTTAFNSQYFSVSSSASIKTSKSNSLGVSGYLGLQRQNAPPTYSVNTIFSQKLSGKGNMLGTTLNYTKLVTGKNVLKAIINLNLSLFGKISSSTTYNTQTNTFREHLTKNIILKNGKSISTSAGVTKCENINTFTGNANYGGDLFNITCNSTLNNNTLRPLSNKNSISQTTQLVLNTAIYNSGRHFGLSRQGASSFIILKAPKLPAGDEITFGRGELIAIKSKFFNAVIPLSDHNEERISPSCNGYSGFDLGEYTSFVAVTKRNSGLFLKLGSTHNCSFNGILKDKNGKPYAYTTLYLTNCDSGVESELGFTSSDGEFSFIGLRPGNYKLNITSVNHEDIIIKIKDHNKTEVVTKELIVKEK